jgi:hypothetical protein
MGLDRPKISLVTTPAGFQPNVDRVYGEIADYLKVRLKNYHPQVEVIRVDNQAEANKPEIAAAVSEADYMFLGPGSPTYAVKHLRGTAVLQALLDRVSGGASLGLASAAAIAFSKFALPVYEIYKVGEPLHWISGLNGYKKLIGEEITVIPHFNNLDGNGNNDTRYCYMGEKRFTELVQMLPEQTRLLGVEEKTAMIYSLRSKTMTGGGKGSVWGGKVLIGKMVRWRKNAYRVD